jgi:repressor LexA
MADLTERRREILEFIQEFSRDRGYPPSIREIGRALGIGSTNGVRYHLTVLAKQGYLTRDRRIFRGMRVLTEQALGRLFMIPLLGRVRAGELDLAVEEREEEVAVDPELFPSHGSRDLFALRVVGDSMTGAGIHEGDLAIVSRESDIKNGDVVVAIVEDDATVKRFRRQGAQILLQPENPDYKPIVVNGEDEGLSFRIAGKVIGIIRTNM